MKVNLKKKFTWIITGGAGFIGSNLIKLLIKQNQNIICVDNLETGFKKNINYKNYKNFKFLKKDIRKLKLIDLKGEKIDFVIHLAALGSVPRSFDNPQKTNSVNVDGSLNIIKISKELKCKKLVFASSSSIYGNSKKNIKNENDRQNPISPYGISKATFENYAEILANFYKLKIIGLRFFNVFGPNQNEKGFYSAVIPKWLRLLIRNKLIPINGDGSTSRDFTYVDNVIYAIIMSCSKNTKNYYDVFNIACQKTINLNYVLNKLIYYMGLNKKNIKIKNLPFKKGDIKKSLANIKKAKKILNYKPMIQFDQGLKMYVNNKINNSKKN
jgi:UDP-N-acetylglucosamine/UDP-N-acetylgalactosamine 4-epimerase